MPVGAEARDERGADESVSTGDEHVHENHANAVGRRPLRSVVFSD